MELFVLAGLILLNGVFAMSEVALLTARRSRLATLAQPAEIALMREVSRWPEVLHQGAEQRAPHLVVHYLRELAQAFHACYAALPFIVDDARTRNARLALIDAARQVLVNALGILGVSAPESM